MENYWIEIITSVTEEIEKKENGFQFSV
jgi:hypothetical protein